MPHFNIYANRSKHLQIIPLNSGGSIYLAPGESTDAIEDYEVSNNEKVEKMLRDNLIASVQGEGGQAAGGQQSQAGAASTSSINTSSAPGASSAEPGAPAPVDEGKVKQR
jgi:hypothetical protein